MQFVKTQYKIIIFISLLALFFAVLLYIIKQTEEYKLAKILVEESKTKRVLIDNIMEVVGKDLESWAFNDSYWDEMVSCVEKKDTTWGNELISSALPTYKAQAAWLYNLDFNLAYSTNVFNDAELKNFPLSKEEMNFLFAKNAFNHFFINSKFGLIEVRTAPIQPSNDIVRKTPPRGYFIVARIWDKKYLERLNVITSSKTELTITKDSTISIGSENSISIKASIKDYKNEQIALISFVSESQLYSAVKSALNWQMITGIIITAGILLAISFFHIGYILNPIKKISLSLEYEKTSFLGDLVNDKNEFGRVARLITEFFKQKQQLREANVTKDKFISIIAHDLRGPFNGFLGFTEILKDESETMTKKEIMEIGEVLNKAAVVQYRLLTDLLQWSRIHSGKMEFEPKKLVLKNIVDFVVETQKVISESKGINVYNNLDPEFEIFADEEMIKLVIRNLVSNAIKFTGFGGSITIQAFNNQNESILSVIDTGVGIPQEDIDKLFRLDVSYTTDGTNNEKGTGLGLVLCKDIIDKHAGSISVSSKIGEGTKFTISLPAELKVK